VNGTIALEAHGVTKLYGRRILGLEDLDLHIRSGTITALVGPNGAGKSTLIKAWVGFERPTRGHVTVAGFDPFRARDTVIGKIGYVPQSTSLYRELTVADHLELVRMMRRGFDRPSATRRLEQLGIPLAQRAGDLSGGQQAQVHLALALGTGAEILLLDEPLASLDPLARREFLHVLMDAVLGSGRTALLSSHIVTDIEQACDHLVILGAGKKLLDRSIAEAIAEHAIGAADPAAPIDAFESKVGSFFDPRGGLVTLVRAPVGTHEQAADGGRRRATLEEIVLGYLAAAKGSANGQRRPAG